MPKFHGPTKKAIIKVTPNALFKQNNYFKKRSFTDVC